MTKACFAASTILLLGVSALAQNMTDQQFVDQAGQINMTETHLGKLAQQKGGTDSVKQYGQQLEKDHTAAYEKLSSIASGFDVPKAIDTQHQKLIQPFEKLSGKRFDTRFKQHMIQDHQKAIDMFKRAATELTNQNLKAYATEQLPTLENHLDMAKQLGTSAVSHREVPDSRPGKPPKKR